MAKPRKQKYGEQQQQQQNKSENSGSIVRHQKLCLSIDMESQRIYGHTEMKIVFPESGVVNLHADNMIIGSVSIDGEPAEFELMPNYQLVEDEKRWGSVSCSTSAADAACSAYLSSLSKEMAPNFLISCHKTMKPVNDQGCQANVCRPSQKPSEESKQLPNGYDNHAENQKVKLVRIDYSVQRAEVGIHFGDNMLCTHNQIKRAHCWFPCLDSILQRCSYDLEFTVGSNFVAVSNGNLLYQVLSNDDPPRKTYVYNMSVPVSAGWISLTVAPFEIFPDCHNGLLTHMCLPPNFSKLQNTVGFFHSAFSHYEDYLSTSFPFGSYKQVFVHPEISISSMSLGASMCIFSSQLLFDEKVVDQTIDTRIKLAYALARQWFGVFVVAETPNDEWLLEGLAGFLADLFIKRFLGNNEARYRRYKANCAVCKVDVSGATALSTSAASIDLHGTQCIGLYGKIRSWKAVAILQMLEKQMGPESFRKILHIIIYRAQDSNRSLRTLSSKEFRHLANKVGNLERPFLKEFFPRWVGSCGCPILRMGFSYNKRRNMIELASIRGCTASGSICAVKSDTECQEGDPGWPGMMSIRVHELDGMYDHPSLPMAGESWQLLEIQCHSRLAAKRYQKPKKGTKPDGSDDTVDTVPTPDTRTCMDSPLLWLRVDPEMEYLAEIHFHQPVQMWINQLEKDKDVVAQSQAIATLRELPRISFSIVNTLNNFLNDSKAFWRVRIEAAFALAHTASEDTDWAGLLHLVKFYKSRRFDADIGLPRPNDFHDVPEYFVLEAIPHAIALIRAADKKSPREAVEFVLQLLKYNDNSGNPYSDVYWLAALVQAVGELEFGQQNIVFLSSLLKRIDRLLQFDSLMPSYNGILTISCIRTLTQIAVKMSSSVPLDRVFYLVKSFDNSKRTPWKVRVEASRALLNLEYHLRGLDAAMSLFVDFVENELSLRGQVKLAVHAMHLCQTNGESESAHLKCPTLAALLHLLVSRKAHNNVFLRHHLFCILQIVAGRPPTLFGVSRVQIPPIVDVETYSDEKRKASFLKLKISGSQEPMGDTTHVSSDALPVAEIAKDAAADTVSNGNERRVPLVKIRVIQAAASSKVGINNEAEFGPSSSVSVDAPLRGDGNDLPSTSNQNLTEEVNSSHGHESRITASIGSAKIVNNEGAGKELQCTADSRSEIPEDHFSPALNANLEADTQKNSSLQSPIVEKLSLTIKGQDSKGKGKKDKKRKRDDKQNKKGHHQDDDAEYLKRKRRKKEKKRIEKELAKVQSVEAKSEMYKEALQTTHSPSLDLKGGSVIPRVSKNTETKGEGFDGIMGPKVRIKIKSRSIGNL